MPVGKRSYNDGLTALASGGQSGAPRLRAQAINRVATVASAGDSVMLPVGAPGTDCVVINAGANAMDVFPGVSETINALSANAAYSVAAGNSIMFHCGTATKWYSSAAPAATSFTGNNAITAHAGGGQASAVALVVNAVNRVTVVATAADSVKLPAASAGAHCYVINSDASDAMDVFPASGETINALSADTALSVAAGATAVFVSPVAGKWFGGVLS